MGRTTMDPGHGNNMRYAPGPESVRSHPPTEAARSSYGGSNRGSYYPAEPQRSNYPPPPASQRSFPPPPESQRSYHPPSESHRSYHPPPESQRSFPLESHRSSYHAGALGPNSRAGLYDKIVLGEMLLGSLFGIFGVATMNWRTSGGNIFNQEQESYWVATRALVVLSILMMIISLIIEIIIVVQKSLRKKGVLWIGFVAQIIAVLTMLIAGGVFGHHECGGREGSVPGSNNNRCGYSFWFAMIGSIFSAQGLVFHFFAMSTKY